MVKISIVVLLCVVAFTTGQRITTIHLDGVQYFISRMNPYSPELNYFLAYQYCRSLGLQLASFETKEKAESMTTYLKNAGYGNYDFWTSGNRLGTGMFLWMSTGLPFNATFDFFGNSANSMQTGVLDPVDHNSNTSPQRTARDSSSGAENGCVILRQPTLKWMPEDCSAIKDFICEQTRCYYYNYGSIPVSSAQGRRITSTSATTATIGFLFSTTSMPVISSYAPYMNKDRFDGKSYSPFVSLRLDHDEPLEATEDPLEYNLDKGNYDNINVKIIEHKVAHQEVKADEDHYDHTLKLDGKFKHTDEKSIKKLHDHLKGIEHNDEHRNSEKLYFVKADNSVINDNTVKPNRSLFPSTNMDNTTTFDSLSVGKHLGQIFQKLEKVVNVNKEESSVFKHQSNTDNITRKSLISLSDLIRTLRPNDKHIIPQIDSDYSNALRVLGETSSLVNTDDSRKF